jgi:EAL domain-containing protein (putative c-di-GMP-specific phosphodiesterase class I)
VRGFVNHLRSVALLVMAGDVQNHDQRQALLQAHCKLFRGYVFIRPSSNPQFESEAQLIDRLQDLQPVAP